MVGTIVSSPENPLTGTVKLFLGLHIVSFIFWKKELKITLRFLNMEVEIPQFGFLDLDVRSFQLSTTKIGITSCSPAYPKTH